MKKTSEFLPSKEHIFHCAIYEFNKGNSGAKATKNICETYNENVLKERTCQRWFSKFRLGDFGFKKKVKNQKKKKHNLDDIEDKLKENPFSTIREIGFHLNIPKSTVYDYLKDSGKVNKLGKYVPYELKENEKKSRIDISRKLLKKLDEFNFLDQIITGNEKWVKYDNIVRKRQWIDKKERPISSPKLKRNKKK